MSKKPRPPADTACPCGSGHDYVECCAPYHRGDCPAPTAEALMRSRYSAFAKGLADYLLATWHPSTRPASLDLADDPLHWLGLKIVARRAGGENDQDGRVEFVARYKSAGRAGRLHEDSRFVRENGCWLYVEGEQKGE